jgi:RimJ/RimL family protein N-acetyltransferase
MRLQGERVSLRPLQRADLDAAEAWRPHTDPLYLAWNQMPWHRLGKDLWYELEATDPAVQRFAILDRQERVIGILGLVDVAEQGRPMLSIFLGADYVNQGLGSDALRTILRYVFQDRGLNAVCLQVAASNARARRVYEKCGFRETGRRYRPLTENQPAPYLTEPRDKDLAYVRKEGDRLYLLHYDMCIRAEEWRRRDDATHGQELRREE